MIEAVLLAISAVLSGAEGWEDMEDFGDSKRVWLRQYGSFKADIPGMMRLPE